MGAEALSRTAFCVGKNERHREHPGEYVSRTGATFHHPPLQLPFPDRMHIPKAETADWSILLPLLVKAYAKAEPLPDGSCKARISETALIDYLRKYFFLFMEKQPVLRIMPIIHEQQDKSVDYSDSVAS